MKTYKNRKEVEKKYKWDLSFLLEGKTIEDQIKQYEKWQRDLIKVKESKYNSAKELLSALKKEDKLIILSYKIHNYLNNWINEDVANPKPNEIKESFDYVAYKLYVELGPETPRIFDNEKKIKTYLKKPEFKNYVSMYERIFETKKHQLPKVIQKFRTNASRGDIEVSTPFSILTDAELRFDDAIGSNGKKHKLNHATQISLLKNKDEKVRKTASDNYGKAHLQVKQTLSNFLYQHFKGITVEAKLHNHKNTIDYLVYSDRGSEKLLLALYEAVQKHKGLARQVSQTHKVAYSRRYGKKMKSYDFMLPIVNVKQHLTTEEQKKLVLDSFKPYGKEYTDVVKEAYNSGWIDYKSYPGKRTGAYSIGGTFGIDKKLILMNDDGDIRSAETLAHELGHSMHSYFSDKNNHIRSSQYRIFVAEIASIFNELMFYDHMLKTSNNDKLKLQIMHQMTYGFIGTVYRQTEWSNYEYDLYKGIEEGKPLSTFEAISKLYCENAQKYSAKKLTKKDFERIAYKSITVPHFYYGFYVYKYAIGQIVANIFFNRYKKYGKTALQKFIKNFLSMGGRLQPLELLKHNGIDLEDPKTFGEAFDEFEKQAKEYKKLVNKVYPKSNDKK